MDLTDRRLAEKFAAFEKNHDPAFVYDALEMVEAAGHDVPPGDVAARRRAVAHWLGFFAALDEIIDPTWDPQKLPVKGATPPASDGMVHSSGEVDPATIPDPVARAQYVQALKASKDYNRVYSLQLQLSRIDERAMRVIERLFAERYSASAADLRELEELSAPVVSDARRKRLRALLPR